MITPSFKIFLASYVCITCCVVIFEFLIFLYIFVIPAISILFLIVFKEKYEFLFRQTWRIFIKINIISNTQILITRDAYVHTYNRSNKTFLADLKEVKPFWIGYEVSIILYLCIKYILVYINDICIPIAHHFICVM